MAHIEQYRNFIVKLHSRYGAKAWVLIYQADVRCRKELMPRLRLRLLMQKDMGGCPVAFDDQSLVQRPWDYIWRAVLDET
eukprot:42544-Amphidinium_carterae.1